MIEPGAMAKMAGGSFKASQAGWGSYEEMLATMEKAVMGRDSLLGKDFSMADVIFGGTLRYMLMVKMIDPKPALTAYADRLAARPALQRADARNKAIIEEHGLKMP